MTNKNFYNSINVEDTNFIYDTNFAGDPNKDRYHDSRRKCKILIDEDLAKQLAADNVTVYQTKPSEYDDPNTFEPEYFVAAQVKYRKLDGTLVKYPPKVYLVTDNDVVLQTEDTIANLDNIRVKNVKCVLNPFLNENGKKSLYVRVMYVEQDNSEDPYAEYYRNKRRSHEGENFFDED